MRIHEKKVAAFYTIFSHRIKTSLQYAVRSKKPLNTVFSQVAQASGLEGPLSRYILVPSPKIAAIAKIHTNTPFFLFPKLWQ